MVTNEEMRTEFAYFSEAWKLFKKYYRVQREDPYWKALTEDADAIIREYSRELCRDLVLAIVRELERKIKDCGSETAL